MRFDGAEVARGLGVDELAEGVRPARDVEVGRVVGGQLEEPADRRAALVELAGRVQEARAVAGRGRALRPIAEQRPDAGEGLVAGRRRGDERLEAEVGVGAAPGEVPGQLPDDVAGARGEPERRVAVEGQAVAAGDRLDRAGCVRGAPVAAVASRLEQVAGQLLGLLDVRLVERVDAEDGPGDRDRDLPADELRAEVDRVGELDPDDRVAGGLERIGQAVASRRRPTRRARSGRTPGPSRRPRPRRAARRRPARSRRRACRCSPRSAARPTPRSCRCRHRPGRSACRDRPPPASRSRGPARRRD